MERNDLKLRNRDFAGYEQVEKQQDYRLAEAEGVDEFDDDFKIASCNVGKFLHGTESEKRVFADELGAAMRDIGFAILEDPEVDVALYEQASRAVEDMFTRVSLEQKMAFRARRHGMVNEGYYPVRETSTLHPDLVEGWVFCRRALQLDEGRATRVEDFWPLPEYEPLFRRHIRQHERLYLPVIQSLLMNLGCDPHLYDRALTGTNFVLRLNYYPPLTTEDDEWGGGRLLGHEDVGMFTFLPAPQVEGLQVLNRRNMKWVRISAPPGAIILNTGDYMQRISNDIFPSTTHRVSKPRDPDQRRLARTSFPIVVLTWDDHVLEVLPGLGAPKYPPVTTAEFHTSVTRKIYDQRAGRG